MPNGVSHPRGIRIYCRIRWIVQPLRTRVGEYSGGHYCDDGAVNAHGAQFYFVFPLRRSAQRLFIRSDSFLRPAAVKRLPLRSGALLAVGSPLAVFAALFTAAYLRFMASEIFLRAAAPPW